MNRYYKMSAAAIALAGTLVSCSDTKSYSELLNEEEHAVNWFLSGKRVCTEIPADSVFETGENAPYYKMDTDGFVYMQVIDRGDMNNRPVEGQRVYFRFMRQNIKALFEDGTAEWSGNADNLGSTLGNTSLIYGDNVLQSTSKYGDGLQVPLEYLGYNSRVNLVIKSTMGFTTDQSTCLPYLYDVRYFKAEY